MARLATVKEIVSQASIEIGITQQPVAQAVNSLDQDIAQMVALLAAVARELLLDEPYESMLGDGCWLEDRDGNAIIGPPSQDDDAVRFDAGLAVLGLKWRFRHAKGLEFGEDLRDFSSRLNKLAARQNGVVIDLDFAEDREI
jgi:hypothetical protein